MELDKKLELLTFAVGHNITDEELETIKTALEMSKNHYYHGTPMDYASAKKMNDLTNKLFAELLFLYFCENNDDKTKIDFQTEIMHRINFTAKAKREKEKNNGKQ